MESDNLQFMSNLEGKGYTEMGKREQKKSYFFNERKLCNYAIH